MAANNQIHTALLTEHFRYTPLTLLDDIINTVNETVYRAVNAVEEGLNAAPPQDIGYKLSAAQLSSLLPSTSAEEALHDLKQTEIDTGIIQLESLLHATVDKDFDKFEIYTLRNILAVGGHDEQEARDLARWVRLEHYKGLNLDAGSLETTPKPEEVQLQRRKLQETMKLNAMLKAEEARNEAVLRQLKTALKGGGDESQPSPFAFLLSSPHVSTQPGSHPLSQTAQYALTQLPALQQLLAQLRSSLQTLPDAARHSQLQDEDGIDAVRRRYLDAQSRRALQRKGVEVEDEATRSAQAGLMGRKVGREEVEGIEAVVRALGDAAGKEGEGEGR